MNPFDDELENNLKHALRREEPSAGFAERVITLAAQQSTTAPHHIAPISKPRFSFARLRVLGDYQLWPRWAAAAAVSAALIVGGFHYQTIQREKAQHAEGEAAKQRLMLALRIAGSKLQFAREKVNQINDDGTNVQQEKE